MARQKEGQCPGSREKVEPARDVHAEGSEGRGGSRKERESRAPQGPLRTPRSDREERLVGKEAGARGPRRRRRGRPREWRALQQDAGFHAPPSSVRNKKIIPWEHSPGLL